MRIVQLSPSFKYALVLFIFLATPICTNAQNFNPDNALIISRAKSKIPGLMFNGFRVKCLLKSGKKVKGDLFIYQNHIEIDTTQVTFDEIESIRHLNNNLYTRLASQLALSEVIRQSSGATGTQGLGLSLGINTVLTVVNLTLLQRKYKTKKGWQFTVQDLGALRNPRRRR